MAKQKGVYEIKNLITHHKYIGSSKDIQKRWREHYNRLSRNTHHCIGLQRAWNKYGGFNFSFNILENCQEKDLFSIEQSHLSRHAKSQLYNSTLIAGKIEMTKERRLKISNTKRARGQFKGKNNPMYGKHHTKESNEKNRLSNIGIQAGEKNAGYGKRGEKSYAAKTYIFYSPCGIKHIVKGILEKFCKEQKLRRETITNLLRKSSQASYKGWTVIKESL
jgi:group I intron endonuclease